MDFPAMRYFLNTSAAKPAVVDGHTFEFELLAVRGGTWLGVLALDEPGASIFGSGRWPNTDEISEESYNLQKKKGTANQPNSPGWPKPSNTEPALAIADRVGSPTSHAASNGPDGNASPTNPNGISGLTAVSLLTTRNSPPVEPLLADGNKRRTFAI